MILGCIKSAGSSKFSTTLLSAIWIAGAIALIILSSSQNEDGTQKVDCENNHTVGLNKETCEWTTFVRPFRFQLKGVNGNADFGLCDPVMCGWNSSSYNFHIVNVSFTVLTGLMIFSHLWTDHEINKTLKLITIWLSLALAACYFSSFSIGADSIRRGNELCKDSWKLPEDDHMIYYGPDWEYVCKPSPFIFTILAEIGLSALSGFIFLVLYNSPMESYTIQNAAVGGSILNVDDVQPVTNRGKTNTSTQQGGTSLKDAYTAVPHPDEDP